WEWPLRQIAYFYVNNLLLGKRATRFESTGIVGFVGVGARRVCRCALKARAAPGRLPPGGTRLPEARGCEGTPTDACQEIEHTQCDCGGNHEYGCHGDTDNGNDHNSNCTQ